MMCCSYHHVAKFHGRITYLNVTRPFIYLFLVSKKKISRFFLIHGIGFFRFPIRLDRIARSDISKP